MGIKTEYNPDLALRSYECFLRKEKKEAECLPQEIKEGEEYEFLKKGQRLYWLEGELPLLETKGNEDLSAPLASIVILEATHFLREKDVWTKGRYKVIKKLEKEEVYFNGFNKV